MEKFFKQRKEKNNIRAPRAAALKNAQNAKNK
jgi:hypothetical protein